MYNILKVQDSVKGYVSIAVLEDGKANTYTVCISVYEALGSPARSDSLSEDGMKTVREADEYYRGKRAALSILSPRKRLRKSSKK